MWPRGKVVVRLMAVAMVFSVCVAEQWSDWTPWSECPRTCGYSMRTQSRRCLDRKCRSHAQYRYRACRLPNCDSPYWQKDAIEKAMKTCEPDTCKNGGTCTHHDGKVTCQCINQWRGRKCESPCLRIEDEQACQGRYGLFFICEDCTKFAVCALRGRKVMQRCLGGRVFTGDSCKERNEADARCLETE